MLGAACEDDLFAIGDQHQDRCAGDSHAAPDAMVAGPGAILILHLENLIRQSLSFVVEGEL